MSNREPEKKREDIQRKDKVREGDRRRDERRESNMVKRGSDRERSDRGKSEWKERFDEFTQLTTTRSQMYTLNKDSDK